MNHKEKFCIFCGDKPENKNNEHVLPQWLIEMTGDPKRVVNFGINPKTGEVPRFDWSSFVFPSCSSCNEKYSTLESKIKEIVEKLVAREPARASDYLLLLDWLDKVRTGLWLGYFYLYKNSARISPHFSIDTRIAIKDRMLALYAIDTDIGGLNTHGAETQCFQIQPSCFAINIKSIYILNMSWDYMCSARCGFPFPRIVVKNLDDKDAKYECQDYQITHKIKHPIIRKDFIKPSIHIYEPIIQAPFSIDDYPDDNWLKSKLIPGSENKGVIYRQWDGRVEVITDQDKLIENDRVTGHYCTPLKDIIAQTYDLQPDSYLHCDYKSDDNNKLESIKNMRIDFKKLSTLYRNTWKNMK